MTQDITVTDLFCGAGGSSLGAEKAGAVLRMAANHWRLAIETHNTNFPNADHDCADVSQVRPARYPTTDILIASPECTNHSLAKMHKKVVTLWDATGDEAADRSRATMWDVPRFAEIHRYKIVITENVVEASRWSMFDAWLQAMNALGYDHQIVSLNSAIARPTPQSRDRMYVVFHLRGNPKPNMDIRPLCWCPACEKTVNGIQSWKNPVKTIGKYRAQYVYRCPACTNIALPFATPAAAAIDWSLPIKRIGDRDKALSEATMKRIGAGLAKYGRAVVQTAGNTFESGEYFRTWPLDGAPIPTQATVLQHGIVIDTGYANGADSKVSARPTEWPLPTQTTLQSQGIIIDSTSIMDTPGNRRPTSQPMPPQKAQPHLGLIVDQGYTSDPGDGHVRPIDQPTFTQTAQQRQGLLVTLRGTENGQLERAAKPLDQPTGTITAGGIHEGLALWNSFLVDYHGTSSPKRVTEPHRVMDTRDRYSLVSPGIDIEDAQFRLLVPHEVGAAMAFPADYQVLGTGRDKVRQYGNAVTPPVMELLLQRAIASLKPLNEREEVAA